MANTRSKLKALFIAPLAAPLLVFIVTVFPLAIKEGEFGALFAFLPILIIGGPVSYLATIVFGVPYYMILRHNNMLSLMSLALGGVGFGAIAFLLFWAVPWHVSPLQNMGIGGLIAASIMGSVLGVVVSIIFGLLAGISKRSSRDRAFRAAP